MSCLDNWKLEVALTPLPISNWKSYLLGNNGWTKGVIIMQHFTDLHFQKYSRLIYEKFGIDFKEEKKMVLQTRLQRLMTRHNISSYDDYFRIITQANNKDHLIEFAAEITINKTDFFREMNHFDFIKNNMEFITAKNPRIYSNGEIRVWSAACSTGQEPYTIAMVLSEILPSGIRIKILGTDISERVLIKGQQGMYPFEVRDEIPIYYLQKYFHKAEESYIIDESVKELVTFRLFNLMDPFPFKNSFDIVFCRNVMIYFDSAIQQSLLDKFYQIIVPGGLLFIGHSESLTGKVHRFQYIQPTIYMK